jgi:hypothetical protein
MSTQELGWTLEGSLSVLLALTMVFTTTTARKSRYALLL